jgi:hypothetical protein
VFDRVNGSNGTIYETINGNLYSDAALSKLIGRIAISQTIFDINDTNQIGRFETTGLATLILPNGNIMYSLCGQTVKIGDNYVFPDTQYTFRITNSTGVYQPMNGYIVITSTDEPTELRVFNLELTWPRAYRI